MENRMVTYVTDDVTWPERSSRDPNTLKAQYL